MRIFKILALIGLLGVVGNACTDLAVTNLNDPDRQRAIQTPGDVESLISGSFNSVFWSYQDSYTVCAPGVAANSHSSSWGNWGMRDSSEEPRIAYNNDPSYSYNNQAETPWGDAYSALAGARDGLAAIAEGLKIIEGETDVTPRAVAFGKLVQGMAHANLARFFDQAFIIDENSDLANIELVDSDVLYAAAIGYFNEAIQAAQGSTFTVPSAWVGFGGDWSASDLAQIAKALKVRLTIQMPRSKAERDAVDWNAVLTGLSDGLPFEVGQYYDGNTWGWHRSKLHCGGRQSGWNRIDMRTIGPADVSGQWETWINAAPNDKEPFDIVTPDSRITDPGDPQSGGKLLRWYGNSPYPLSRGIWHFSNYMDYRWDFPSFIGFYPDFVQAEVDFIRAEAWYRLGQFDKAREVVNQYRANGDLPPFVTNQNPDPPASCVPQNANGTCGDLWEALKYEKRIENYHYGSVSEFMDDRGWGDLEVGHLARNARTRKRAPSPLEGDLYFRWQRGQRCAGQCQEDFISFLSDNTPEVLAFKRMALDARLEERNVPEPRPRQGLLSRVD